LKEELNGQVMLMIGSFQMLNSQEIISRYKKLKRRKGKMFPLIISFMKTFLTWKRVKMRIMNRQQLKECMKLLVVFLMKKRKKEYNLFHQKNSQYTLGTLMMVQ